MLVASSTILLSKDTKSGWEQRSPYPTAGRELQEHSTSQPFPLPSHSLVGGRQLEAQPSPYSCSVAAGEVLSGLPDGQSPRCLTQPTQQHPPPRPLTADIPPHHGQPCQAVRCRRFLSTLCLLASSVLRAGGQLDISIRRLGRRLVTSQSWRTPFK